MAWRHKLLPFSFFLEICVNFLQNTSRLFSMFGVLHFFRGTFGSILTQSLRSLFIGSWSSSRVWLLLFSGDSVKRSNKVNGKLQEKCSWSVAFLVTYTSSKNNKITMMIACKLVRRMHVLVTSLVTLKECWNSLKIKNANWKFVNHG